MFRTTSSPIRRSALLAVSALALVVSSLPASADNPVGGHGKNSIDCGTDGTIGWTPTSVWPPNHKEVPITWTYADDSDSDVKLTIIQKLHNQVVNDEELVGSGNTPFATDSFGGTASDTDGEVDVVGYVRGERSGTEQGGRIYSFEYKAEGGPLGLTDGCESDPDDDSDDITITVPHDCRDNWCATQNNG